MHQERSQDDQKHPKTDLKLSKRSPQGVQGFQNETIRGPKGPQREPRASTGDQKRPKNIPKGAHALQRVSKVPSADSQKTSEIDQNDPKGPKKKPRYFRQ